MNKQNIQKKQGRKIRKFLSMGMATILVLSPITGEMALAKTAVPALTKSASINKGKTKTITIQKNGTTIKKVTWKSSDKKVATVKANGKLKAIVKGIKKGSVKITASISYKSGKKTLSKKLTCKVTVKEPKSHGKVIESGTCGGDVKWTYYADDTLYIYGKGDMKDFGEQKDAPWAGYYALKEVEIANGITGIGDYAFYECSSVKSITIPKGVTSIGSYAFYGCSSVKSITIPKGVTSVGNCAFYGCSSLKSITIPKGVKSVGSYAFYGCRSLTSITLPEGVKSIENE